MRLTFLNPVGVVGGAERVLLATLRSAREHLPDAKLHLLLFGEGPMQAEVAALGVSVDVVPLPEPLARWGDTQLRAQGQIGGITRLMWSALHGTLAGSGFIRHLRRVFEQHEPDLIHSNGLKTHALTALARPRGVPLVWHLHDFYSQRPVMARALKALGAGVRGGIAVSEAVKRDAETVLPKIPVTVVRNAIDTSRFSPAECDGAVLDRLAALPESAAGTIRVGIVATYANWKGQDVFLDALARAPCNVRGYIIGGPIYATAGSQFTRAELEQRAAAHGLAGRVGFVPFQADPVAAYRALDVVVHASTRPEPFGLTIVEGMSCGKPVVVAAGGGATELFTDGVDAIAHPPGDSAALSAAIARLVADAGLRARISSAARQTAVSQFSLERYGREIVGVYQNLIDQ